MLRVVILSYLLLFSCFTYSQEALNEIRFIDFPEKIDFSSKEVKLNFVNFSVSDIPEIIKVSEYYTQFFKISVAESPKNNSMQIVFNKTDDPNANLVILRMITALNIAGVKVEENKFISLSDFYNENISKK
jgi:hypothetical protein